MHRKIIYSVLLVTMVIWASSCSSTFYYSTLNTIDENLEKRDNGDFVYENDSLWITHSFKGEDAPIQISVFNKLNVPLYVDWSRSALIINDIAYSYDTGETFHYEDVFFGDTHHTTKSTRITKNSPNQISFIPPKAMITHQSIRIAAQFDEISKKEYKDGKMATKDEDAVKIKRITYDYDDSPLHFDSYVTVYTKPEEESVITSNFYVTNLIKTKVRPSELPQDMGQRGDTFYQRIRPDNSGWAVLAVVGLTAVDVIVSIGENEN